MFDSTVAKLGTLEDLYEFYEPHIINVLNVVSGTDRIEIDREVRSSAIDSRQHGLNDNVSEEAAGSLLPSAFE